MKMYENSQSAAHLCFFLSGCQWLIYPPEFSHGYIVLKNFIFGKQFIKNVKPMLHRGKTLTLHFF